MERKKIFYVCPRGISAHIHLYVGWILEARKKNLPIYLCTTISFKDYFKLPPYLKRRELIFIPCSEKFEKFILMMFFCFLFIINKQIIVQIRKRGTYTFELLKKIFPKRFKLVIESEGDIQYEFEYLENHPYKKGFYSSTLERKDFLLKRYKASLIKADHIICVSDNLKKLYASRYSIDESKLTSLTTGCDSNRFIYNPNIRKKYRKILGIESKFVLIYVGSVHFSWQNISRTLEVYKIIKNINKNAIFIIITRLSDKAILEHFLNKHHISPKELIIKYSVPNSEIPLYLNASDLGIVLRDNHPLNHVAAPGKFGEYLSCGLPLITGIGIADFSEKLAQTSYGIVLNDIKDDQEFITKFKNFIDNYENINRNEISLWAIKLFSFQEHIMKYVKLMRRLLKI